MPLSDAYGYDLTLDDAVASQHWDATVRAFLAHSAATATHLGATLTAAPAFALAHAAKGFFMLLLGRRELIDSAREAYQAANRTAPDATLRERRYVEALGLYLDGQIIPAANLLDETLKAYPRDALLMKLVHALRFILGDAVGMRSSIESVIPVYGDDHPAAGYINGCYAFALEETGDYLAAERRGRDGLVIARDDAWGLHAVAHVYDMTNRTSEGVAWISRQPQAWEHCNNFGYHVWWHLALFHLDRGEHGRVLELYDQEIRKDKTDDYRDISNAASLLMRLELEGVDVGDRWEEIAEISASRTEDGCVVFADLHYLLALNGDQREDAACKLLTAMRTNAERRLGCMDEVASSAGVPAGNGLIAFAAGDYATAYSHLTSARAHMPTVGGSHAQRDVFERITIEAALRAGLLTEARATLQDRSRRRGASDRYTETRLVRISELQTGDAEVAAAVI
ncbi:MAG: tetratricopeptide repeat protein [Rhodobacteraceae bacterium]|nr:tetratricopeptide repeat protein [Paracoccaceae bacterium]